MTYLGYFPPPKRSGFVSTLAWTSIIVSVLGVIAAIALTVLASLALPALAQNLAVTPPESPAAGEPSLSGFVPLVSSFIRLFCFGSLVFAVANLVVSIEFLRRKNWARLAFVAILAFTAVSTLLGTLLPQSLLTGLSSSTEPDLPQLGSIVSTLKLVFVISSVAFCLFLAWLIWRLLSARVAAEFRKPARQPR